MVGGGRVGATVVGLTVVGSAVVGSGVVGGGLVGFSVVGADVGTYVVGRTDGAGDINGSDVVSAGCTPLGSVVAGNAEGGSRIVGEYVGFIAPTVGASDDGFWPPTLGFVVAVTEEGFAVCVVTLEEEGYDEDVVSPPGEVLFFGVIAGVVVGPVICSTKLSMSMVETSACPRWDNSLFNKSKNLSVASSGMNVSF